jgi:hypothetical protein
VPRNAWRYANPANSANHAGLASKNKRLQFFEISRAAAKVSRIPAKRGAGWSTIARNAWGYANPANSANRMGLANKNKGLQLFEISRVGAKLSRNPAKRGVGDAV